MAIIIQHLETGNEYIFLGVDGGESKTLSPKKMLGDLFSREENGTEKTVTVCDYRGRILWFPVDEVVVIEVDGQKPGEILPEVVASEPVPLKIDNEEKLDRPTIDNNNDDFADEDDDWI